MLVLWYLLGFLTGFSAAALIAYLRGRKKSAAPVTEDEFLQILNF
ncbi:MAG: cytochrome c-type biogenesis protein CcmH [Ruminococcaceae bacterium]|nr:cytochrome c-type biogenesis protein CcmH [Oscillospiraceae bacterium]